MALGGVGPAGAAVDLVISNATLIDPGGDGADRVVNLHFDDGELVLVTEDPADREGAATYDARGGVIVGALDLNERPSLLILDGDPRAEFSVLRDTRGHTLFAMEEGQVAVNLLRRRWQPEPGTGSNGWLAYTPPPFAMPVRYKDTSRFNRFETKAISGLVTGALVADRTSWLSQDEGSVTGVGDLGEFSGGEIRGLRAGVAGTLNFETPWVYVIAGATNAFDKGFELENPESFTFFDWRVDIPAVGGTTLSVGKQKEPISMERLTGMVFLPWQERSIVADALLPSRNVGVVWSGYNAEHRYSWAGGVFNDWIDTDASFSDSASQFAGRLTWAPSLSGDESNLLHLGAGYRYSNAKEGQRYRSEPEINKAPLFVDTGRGFENGLYEADGASLYNLELGWRAGPLFLSSEYFAVRTDADELQNPDYDGYYLSASWALTGEMRSYDARRGLFRQLPVARGVYNGGHGAVEAAVRFSSVDLSDGLIDGGESEVASLGLNWWLTPFFQFGVNYRYIWNTLDGIDGTSSAINTRLLLILE